jgi:hypothetical protein
MLTLWVDAFHLLDTCLADFELVLKPKEDNGSGVAFTD